jgi:hypothetical protein
MDLDTNKIDDAVLALLYLELHVCRSRSRLAVATSVAPPLSMNVKDGQHQ